MLNKVLRTALIPDDTRHLIYKVVNISMYISLKQEYALKYLKELRFFVSGKCLWDWNIFFLSERPAVPTKFAWGMDNGI